MQILELINSASKLLKSNNIQSNKLDSEILLSKALNKKREELLLNLEKNVSRDTINRFEKLISSSVKTYLQIKQAQIKSSERNILNLNPKEVFKRGYAMVSNSEGKNISSIKHINEKDKLSLQVLDGNIETEVISVGEIHDKQ